MKKYIILIVIVIFIGLISIGIYNTQIEEPKISYYNYNDHYFVKEDNLWSTLINESKTNIDVKYPLKLHYGPQDLEAIPISRTNETSFLPSNKTYISFYPKEKMGYVTLAVAELSYTLANGFYLFQNTTFNPTIVCASNDDPACNTYPIINCKNSSEHVIELIESEINQIKISNTCIKIYGKDTELLKGIDKLLYTWLGIMK